MNKKETDENILYYISNKENSYIRDDIKKYARSIKEDYIEYVREENINFENCNLDEFYNILKEIFNNDRYCGLNFKNLGLSYKNTIEFRLPNGEINFNELMHNIKLFALLVQKSKYLTHTKCIEE